MTIPQNHSIPGEVFRQDFLWHDVEGNLDYAAGQDAYLTMDGSNTPLRCRRNLARKITDSFGGVELRMRVIARRAYHLRLLDGNAAPVVDGLLDSDGWIKRRCGSEYVKTGQYLTWHHDTPLAENEAGLIRGT